ncbi:hypothetical protein FRC20_009039 [Serendipita sp. 405]|nr:hypothetical protein FRC20_009039 [Serendipita sp. 405]
MLAIPTSPVPSINIEFCAGPAPLKEPSSPFDNIQFSVDIVGGGDKYRSHHLLPPPVHSPKERPTVAVQSRPPQGKGLDVASFEALRAASKNRQDLRKEVAVRAHQSKQIERRNHFLSKIQALPSPTAACQPVTPPESPAVFHFTLPSPGLVSPLALFETLEEDRENLPVRVEQVDFRARARKEAQALAALTGNMKQSLRLHSLVPVSPRPQVRTFAPAHSVPSLDQISKRLGGAITVSRSGSPPGSRLPAFLQKSAEPSSQEPAVEVHSPAPQRPFVPTNLHGPIARPTSSTGVKSSRPPLRPASVTLPGPRIASTKPPTPLTAQALNALADRAERGSVMMERLQRRFSAPARFSEESGRVLARPVGGF